MYICDVPLRTQRQGQRDLEGEREIYTQVTDDDELTHLEALLAAGHMAGIFDASADVHTVIVCDANADTAIEIVAHLTDDAAAQ